MITDFGLATGRAEEAPEATCEGWTEGTPEYMAPEQARGEKPGPAADIYALGTVLFEMATGRLPFEEPNPARILERKRTEHAPSPRALA